MAESAAYARRGHKGGAKATTIVGGITSGATAITCADLSTWAGATTQGPAAATIDLGLATEETVEFTGISGNDLTGVTRGVGGTTATAHAANAPIVHSSRDRDFAEANAHIADDALDHHGQYALRSILTTRGDLPVRGAAVWGRLAVGAANRVLRSDGTDPSWGQVVTGDIADDNITDAKIAPGIRYESITGFGLSPTVITTATQLERATVFDSGTVNPSPIPVVMDRAGSIIGLRVACNGPRTAGTLACEVYKNGVATGLIATVDGTNTQYVYTTQAAGLDTFVAGDRLDVRATNTGFTITGGGLIEAVITVGYD